MKADFKDGDRVRLPDGLGSSHGTVVHTNETLGVLVYLGGTQPGMSYGTLDSKLRRVHVYFFEDDIRCYKD